MFIYTNNIFTLQASATVMPYWYLADIDLGIVWDKLMFGWILFKHIIIAFIKVSWAILINAVSFSENSLQKCHKITALLKKYHLPNYFIQNINFIRL